MPKFNFLMPGIKGSLREMAGGLREKGDSLRQGFTYKG